MIINRINKIQNDEGMQKVECDDNKQEFEAQEDKVTDVAPFCHYKCKNCSKEFTTSSENHIFLEDSHSRVNWRVATCPNCGNPIFTRLD